MPLVLVTLADSRDRRMMATSKVTACGLVALLIVGATSSAELNFERIDASLKDTDRMLQDNGLTSSASDEDLDRILTRNISSGHWDGAEKQKEPKFVHYLRNIDQVDCKSEAVKLIGRMATATERQSSSFSVPLRNYVEHAFDRVTGRCTRVLVDWYFEQFSMANELNSIELLVDSQLERVDEMESSEFYGHLADRLEFVARENGISVADLFDGLSMMNYVMRNTLANFGKSVPVNKLEGRARKYYLASEIANRFEKNFHADLVEFIRNKSPKEFERIKNAPVDRKKWELNLDVGLEELARERNVNESQLVELLRATCDSSDQKLKSMVRLVRMNCHQHFQFTTKTPEAALPWQLARLCPQ